VTSRGLQVIGGREEPKENMEQGLAKGARRKTPSPVPERNALLRIAHLARLIIRFPPLGVKSDYRTDHEKSEKQKLAVRKSAGRSMLVLAIHRIREVVKDMQIGKRDSG